VSEVRALLLTDVVDSAQLSERLGEAELAALWAAHDRLARDLLPARRGREIDKTDGMLLLFEAAADAVAYAVAYQRAVAGLGVFEFHSAPPSSGWKINRCTLATAAPVRAAIGNPAVRKSQIRKPRS